MSPLVFVLLTWALVATLAAVRFALLAAEHAEHAAWLSHHLHRLQKGGQS